MVRKMIYTDVKLSEEVINLMKVIRDNAVSAVVIADGCSIHPNWERLHVLEDLGFVQQQPNFVDGVQWGPPVYFLSNKGEAYLEDYISAKKREKSNRLKSASITMLTSAITTLIINIAILIIKAKFFSTPVP